MSSINPGEQAQRSENGPTLTGQSHDTNIPLPSSQVPPKVVDDLPQQASTQPDDGAVVHAETDSKQVHNSGQNYESVGRDTRKSGGTSIPFKEQVIGVAQKTRGTLLGKPELVEHGEKILEGKTTHEQDR